MHSAENDKSVIAYHIRQSFKPGEVTPELANKIGYETALKFTKGKHQFIVATHVDKSHIHNHAVFNSTALDGKSKFRDFLGSGKAVAKISDELCAANGLSVIEKPKRTAKDYGEWLGEEKNVSQREALRCTIDAVLDKKPVDIDDFVRLIQAENYEVKQGKSLAFRLHGQQKFMRLRSLGASYSDDVILEIITGKKVVLKPAVKINLLIDIEQKIREGKGGGYENWAKIHNLKEAAKTLVYLQENNLTEYEKLEEKTDEAKKIFDDLSEQIMQKDNRLNEISTLQRHIGNYSKTRDIYTEYIKSGYNKNFLAEHENDIISHQSAKKYFDGLNIKIPSMQSLKQAYAAVLAEKKKLYSDYHQAKSIMQELINAQINTDKILGQPQTVSGRKKHSHDR